MEQRSPLRRREVAGQTLERIPHDAVRIRHLIDREVALEHAPVDSEFLYAPDEVGRHGFIQFRRARR